MNRLLGLISIFLITTILSTGCINEDEKDIQHEMNNDTEEKSETFHHEPQTDIDPIKQKIDLTSDESITVLVNKLNSLSEQYVPEDLVTVSVPTVLENPEVNQLRAEADTALTDMFESAEKEGFFLFARSGYRSYNTQVHLFDGYAEKHGEEAANTYSAKPGFSEHQTGLVMDITSESVQFQLTEQFGETDEGKWVAEHAHQFGFIIRYPQHKEDITGYIYEPWHLRYLGKEVAEAVYESDVTYEEFLVDKGVIDDVKYAK